MDGRWKNSKEATYIIAQTNEEDFLNYSGNTLSSFDIGCDVWWMLENKNGFRRNYSSGLKSELGKKYIHSHQHNLGDICQSSESSYDIPDVYGESCYDSHVAQPVLLDKNYFGKSGSIIVAAKRPLKNPFTTMFDSNAKKSLYGAFNGKNKDMWVISAARAGVRFNNDNLGYYRIQYPDEKIEKHDYTNNVWNLCEDDWDAVLIPVARAWNNTIKNDWGKDENGNDSSNSDTSNLLDAVKKALNVSSPYGEKGYVISNDNPMRH